MNKWDKLIIGLVTILVGLALAYGLQSVGDRQEIDAAVETQYNRARAMLYDENGNFIGWAEEPAGEVVP